MSEMIFVARSPRTAIVIVSDTFEITLDTDLIIFRSGTAYSGKTGEELGPISTEGEAYCLSTEVQLTGKAVRSCPS